jgi:DNA-binding NtrC family response regulator
MVRLRDRIATVAPSDLPVLVSGESGTGKELVARAIHDLGARRDGPFVPVNCAAFPEALLEAELFGYERGAFTGAHKKRAGRFLSASGGTLFLDEVGELSLAAQVKLLRAAQDGMVTPLGSDTPVATDVRIVSATNRDLRARIAEKAFREDLYYRLAGVHVPVPPLRDRSGDVPLLVAHFLRAQAVQAATEPPITPEAWATLTKHPWPGNVRELSHAVQHAVVMARGGPILPEHFPEDMSPHVARASGAARATVPLAQAMKRHEREILLAALGAAEGKRTRAAELLGISRKNLWEKLKAHDISDSDVED